MIRLLKLRPYMGDVAVQSPNHDIRKAMAIQGIVLHATADAGDEAHSVTWMLSRNSRVSCHLLVGRDGRVIRLVGDQQRAWHAGLSWWRGTSDVNSITLGIELANRNDGEPYTEAQYRRTADVVVHYCRQGLSLDDVVSHEEVAGGRKSDPLGWDWLRFRGMVLFRLRMAAAARPSLPRVPAAPPLPIELPGAPPSRPQVTPPPAHRHPLPTAATPRHPATPATAAPSTRAPADVTRTPSPPTVDRSRGSRPARKRILCSRTLWVNGVAVLAAAIVMIAEGLDLLHGFGFPLPKDHATWALFGVGLVNMLLRFGTTCPVGTGLNVRDAPPVTALQLPARLRVDGTTYGHGEQAG